ncbi:hypothetical protein ACRCUN_21790 [Mycobacterium sp. LTG2003]
MRATRSLGRLSKSARRSPYECLLINPRTPARSTFSFHRNSPLAPRYLMQSERWRSRCRSAEEQTTTWGKTPLYYASEQQQVEIMSALLDAGADPNIRESPHRPSFGALDRNRQCHYRHLR